MFSSEHLSIVHSNGSPQGSPLWVQVPSTQVSVPLQKMSSLHGAVLLTWPQPVAGSHESSVQGLLSSQLGPVPPTQAPPEQVSPVVQAFPSSQGLLLLVNTHPVAGSHVSVVQMLLSLQVGAGPPTHTPPEQVSPVVHALLSSHGAVLFVWTQCPLVASQVSVVQTLPSSQVAGHATTTVTVDSLESFGGSGCPCSTTVTVPTFVTSFAPTGKVASSWHWNVKVFVPPAETGPKVKVMVVTGGSSVVQLVVVLGSLSSQERNVHPSGT